MAEAYAYRRLNKDDAAVLLVDHQAGLISLVQDYTPNEFKNNVLALAASAKYFKLPTILTTSFEDGPNGPIVPELKEMFPDAPYIPRPGQINAWDNEDFVEAVKQDRPQAADHRRRGDRRLRGLPGALGLRGGLRGVRGHRRLRHLQHGCARRRADAHAGGRRAD